MTFANHTPLELGLRGETHEGFLANRKVLEIV
jgi:hypothetical protein